MSWTSAFKLFLDIFNDLDLGVHAFLASGLALLPFVYFLDILFNDLDLGVHALASGLAFLPFVYLLTWTSAFKHYLDIFNDLDLGVHAFLASGLALLPFVYFLDI